MFQLMYKNLLICEEGSFKLLTLWTKMKKSLKKNFRYQKSINFFIINPNFGDVQNLREIKN
ncbi:hypothetical protein BpHYR1_002990 [Brachionus plicatilis]|uniref:Uncharacterized protein n=1 Tax=Brachionus plicatilis TaxID=10195 RepID=A0A3M7RUV1_BRAPC|nr:hypothetical protein BpHYR1_002990 [Brachionus plicatilis]